MKRSFLGLNSEESKEAIEIIETLDINMCFADDVINELYNIGEDWLAEHISSNKDHFRTWISEESEEE